MKKFTTKYRYKNREEKAFYVWEKYKLILENAKILDVGADQCYLRSYLPDTSSYIGIGLEGDDLDQIVNLEKEKIPFGDNEFDTVLCLDVLEHLENIHEVFGELCRVSKSYIVISLPNPYHAFYNMIVHGDYGTGRGMKFYYLPPEPPPDRHRWFFREAEARTFLEYNAQKAGFSISQIDAEGEGRLLFKSGLKGKLICWILKRYFNVRSDLNSLNLLHGTLWCVLKNTNSKNNESSN